jgi:cell wall assembly regulator SMI1
MTLETDLARFQAWMQRNHPAITFNPGADQASIQAVEAAVGRSLPPECQTYLGLLNGERWNSAGAIGNWRLLDTASMVKSWRLMNNLLADGVFGANRNPATPAIKGHWWNPAWIPLVDSGSGHYFCLDLDPNRRGKAGQVMLFLHDSDKRHLIARSLPAWIGQIVADLEQNRYELVETNGTGRFRQEAFMHSSLEGQTIYDYLL